jgi:polyisoprenoid-binding protein YceI
MESRTVRFSFVSADSRFTVQAFAGGLLSFMAHSPTFAVRAFAGAIELVPGSFDGASVFLTIRADALELTDRVSAQDRMEIVGRMRREVLETAAFPQISYHGSHVQAKPIADYEYLLRIRGPLTLHGITTDHPVDARLVLGDGWVRLAGVTTVRLSDHRIRPVTAVGGTIRLRDDLAVTFDLLGRRQEDL